MKQSITMAAMLAILGANTVNASGQIQGEIGITLRISEACEVANGVPAIAGRASMTQVDFGPLSSTAFDTMVKPGALKALTRSIALNCSLNVPYAITLGHDETRDQTRVFQIVDSTGTVLHALYQDLTRAAAGQQSDARTLLEGIPVHLRDLPASAYRYEVPITVTW